MSEDLLTIRVPAFHGRKTLAFNLAVLAFATYAATLAAMGSEWAILSVEASALLAAVCLVNVLLRFMTNRPVNWRSRCWLEYGTKYSYTEEKPEVSFDPSMADVIKGMVELDETSAREVWEAEKAKLRAERPNEKIKAMRDRYEHAKAMHKDIPRTSRTAVHRTYVGDDHAARNEENARRIEEHLDHLRAAELPMDYDDEGESGKVVEMVNGHTPGKNG